MTSKEQFKNLIAKEISDNKRNNFLDNWDTSLFGEYKQPRTANGIFKAVGQIVLPSNTFNGILINKYLGPHLEGLTYLYNRLEDPASKDILIKVLVFRVVGHRKIKLPLSNSGYWENFKNIETLVVDENEAIDIPIMGLKLRKYDLSSIGYPISLFFVPFGIMADFVVKQYVYEEDFEIIKAEENDIVIDAGACWGDTALFFSNAVGKNGKVYSYEFVPSNLEVFQKNLSLNPELMKRVELVNHPVWKTSEVDIYYTNNGPSSLVSTEKFENFHGRTKTLSIDDLVTQRNIQRVDFIKMDIEGAEPFALEGARQTLIKYKPKLAISIYHYLDHFSSILKYIESLNLGYKFYLKHATIHSHETILFAKAS